MLKANSFDILFMSKSRSRPAMIDIFCTLVLVLQCSLARSWFLFISNILKAFCLNVKHFCGATAKNEISDIMSWSLLDDDEQHVIKKATFKIQDTL